VLFRSAGAAVEIQEAGQAIRLIGQDRRNLQLLVALFQFLREFTESLRVLAVGFALFPEEFGHLKVLPDLLLQFLPGPDQVLQLIELAHRLLRALLIVPEFGVLGFDFERLDLLLLRVEVKETSGFVRTKRGYPEGW